MKQVEERRLPKQVDVFKLTQQAVELDGNLAVEDMPRLSVLLSVKSTVIHTVIHFAIDDEGHRTAHSHLRAGLWISCQRCLEAMPYDVISDIHWAFVATDEAAKALPAHLEPVMLPTDSNYVDLYEALEDELLLSLPISAFHERCEGASSTRSFGKIETDTGSKTEKPFAALADLKGKLKDGLKQ